MLVMVTAQKADSILILKKDHVMELLAGGKVIRTYKVALGQGGLAPKEREGDGRTPEGHYIIDAKYAESHYHKALHVSYPNAEDRKRAAKLGVSPGGAIMIHGLPNGKGWMARRTGFTTGRWAASPSPTRRSTRSGAGSGGHAGRDSAVTGPKCRASGAKIPMRANSRSAKIE
jgi:hypothetical protein